MTVSQLGDLHKRGAGSHRWLIDQIAPDFKLLDVWALPVEGKRDDFTAFLEAMSSFDPAHTGPILTRALFWVRLRIGALLGWDDPDKKRPIPGDSDTTLRNRLPDDLRASPEMPFISSAMRQTAGGFTPLYFAADECAAEISNETVHGALHLAWVRQKNGRYRAQLGVYVKARGLLGEIYLKVIGPFRHVVVYPSLMRSIGRAWEARTSPMRVV